MTNKKPDYAAAKSLSSDDIPLALGNYAISRLVRASWR